MDTKPLAGWNAVDAIKGWEMGVRRWGLGSGLFSHSPSPNS